MFMWLLSLLCSFFPIFSPFISGNYDYRDGAATRLEIWPLVGRDGTERYDLAHLSRFCYGPDTC